MRVILVYSATLPGYNSSHFFCIEFTRHPRERILIHQQARQPNSLRRNNAVAITSIKKTSLAMSLSGAMFLPLAAMAQSAAVVPAAPAASPAQAMPAVVIYGKALDPNPNAEVGAPYKAKTSGDARHTRPLAETPQTIAVITKAAIDDSGLTDLKQILSAQPGITLGTGENGNAFGDRYIIRGQEARSDVFVDGLRDPGMSTRESFAIEQIEISTCSTAKLSRVVMPGSRKPSTKTSLRASWPRMM